MVVPEVILLVTEEQRQQQQVRGDGRWERLPATWDLGATLEMVGRPWRGSRRRGQGEEERIQAEATRNLAREQGTWHGRET